MVSMKTAIRWVLSRITSFNVLRNLLRIFTISGLLPSIVWKRLPVDILFRVFLEDNSSFTYYSNKSDVIGRFLFWKGIYSFESETMNVFQRLINEADLFIDVGANTGVYSLFACTKNPAIRVITFEPVRRIFDILYQNIERNGYMDRCQVKNMAVSDFDGQTQFHVPCTEMPTSASLNPEGFRGVDGELIEVEVVRIDSLEIEDADSIIIKIDVEGFEQTVFRGMKKLIQSHFPIIIAECIDGSPTKGIDAILSESGYSIYHLSQHGPKQMTAILPDPKEKERNYLFIPPGRRELLQDFIIER